MEINAHRQVIALGFGGGLASDQTAPGFVALVDDLCSVTLVFGFARESECVLGLSIRDFVDTMYLC